MSPILSYCYRIVLRDPYPSKDKCNFHNDGQIALERNYAIFPLDQRIDAVPCSLPTDQKTIPFIISKIVNENGNITEI